MSVQNEVEFRVSKPRLVAEAILLGGFFLFMTDAPLFSGNVTTSVLIYVASFLVADLLLAWYFYWWASLSYLVCNDGLTIRDYRGDTFLKWDEIAGVRKWPFGPGWSRYNLELKSGKTQKLHLLDEEFIDCLKFYLPQTKYWWSAE